MKNLFNYPVEIATMMFLFSFLNLTLAQSEESIIAKFLKRNHTYNGTTLPYRLFIPKNYKSEKAYPLVLCLHGAGERGTDNELHIRYHRLATSWADSVNQSKHPCFVVAPQCPNDNKWVDADWNKGEYRIDQVPISNELLTVNNLLDSLISEFNIDKDRLYITGLSMGGYGTWDMITRFPNRFAAAIPMSGGGDSSKIDLIKNIAVWDFHGAKDDVVPVSGSRKMMNAFRNAKQNVIFTQDVSSDSLDHLIANNVDKLYTEYPEVAHAGWAESFSNPQLFTWVFSKVKKDKH